MKGFEKILNLGVRADNKENDPIFFVNLICSAAVSICIVTILAHIIMGSGLAAFISLPIAALFIVPLYLNVKGKSHFASTYLFFYALIVIACATLFLKETLANKYFFFNLTLIPFLIFPVGKIRQAVGLSLIAGLSGVTMDLVPDNFKTQLMSFETETNFFMNIVLHACAFLLSTLSIGALFRRTSRYLSQVQSEHDQKVSQAKLASLGTLTAGITHEISNPLTILKTKLDQAIRQEKIAPDMAVSMERQIDRMIKLTRSMQNFARQSANDPMEDLNIADFVQEIEFLCHLRLKRRDVLFYNEVAKDLTIKCHPIELSQIFVNLVQNAADAVAELDERWIKFRCENVDNSIKFMVIDSGHGIPDSISEQIFSPFFTTKPPSAGTGLGLAITANIVEKLSGTITTSMVEGHTCFEVSIPRVKLIKTVNAA